MRRKSIIILTMLIVVALLVISGKILESLKPERVSAQIFGASSLLLITSPTSSISVSKSSSVNPDNSPIIVPIIDLIGTIITTLGVVISAMIANKYLRRRKKGKKQEPQIDKNPLSNEEWINLYKDKLQTKPEIAILQILKMPRPLQVTDVYVPLRLSHDEKSIDELAWEARYDPAAFPQINHRRLKNHARTAMEPEEAISKCLNKHCVVVGDPGAGKTTLLKYLAVKSAKGKLSKLPNLPVYINLNTFARTGKSNLLDFASSEWEENYEIPKEKALLCIKENLKAGNVLFLLDGLNETATEETSEDSETSYNHVTAAIMHLGIESPIVVTTRKADYSNRPPLGGFTKVDVLDFRPEDIRKFVNCWFVDHPNPQRREDDPKELNDILENNPRIQALARNPLLLTAIAIVYEKDRYLPKDRAELYRRCVEVLLSEWNAEHNIYRPKQFTVEHKTNLLGDVAWYFHLQGQRFFPKKELLTVIAEFLPAIDLEEEQNRQILDAITIENGLLKEQAPELYGFLHMTMQEYFVARQIYDDQIKINTLLKHCEEPWWEEVLLHYIKNTNDASMLIERLLERGSKLGIQVDIFHTNHILAGQCIATRPIIRRAPLREKIIKHLFDILKNTPYSLTRKQIIEVLAKIGGPREKTQLLGLLSNENILIDIRMNIANALGSIGDPSWGRELLDMLSISNIDKDICKHIAKALGKLGKLSLVPGLVFVLQKPGIDDEVRESIADALDVLDITSKLDDDSKAVSDLFRLLSNTQVSSQVRGRAAHVLGKLGQPSLAPQLLAKLSEQTIDPHVRMHIANALGMLGERYVVNDLLLLLSDQQTEQEVRMSIADALARLGDQSVVQQLNAILFNHNDNPEVRGHVVIALGMLGDQSLISTLPDLFSSPGVDIFIRKSAVIALGKLAERFPIDDLVKKISTTLMDLLSNRRIESGVRIRIADTLGSLGDRTLASHLLNMLLDSSVESEIREAIVDALGRLGAQTITSHLRELLFDSRVELSIRGHIAYVLGMLREASAFPMLVELLSEEKLDPHIRWLIADSLGVLRERAQTSMLIPLLSRNEIDRNVRRHIADVLAQLDDIEEGVYELAELLQTSDIADSIHHTLWVVSRKIGVRIVIPSPGKPPEIVKWRTEFDL